MAYVKIERGTEIGRIYELTESEMDIGRHEMCKIVIKSIQMSRRHARIVTHEGTYLLEDQKSPGGTMLNGSRILGPSALHDGDVIQIAGTHFSFHSERPCSPDCC